MFSFTSSGTLFAGRHDPAQERAPPPLPTAISFPSTETCSSLPKTWSRQITPDLFQRYARIRKLGDVTPQHLASLNVSFQNIADIADFFSTREVAEDFLPPSAWLERYEQPSAAPADSSRCGSRALRNGRPYPSQHDFLIRSREVRHENDAAFRVLTRTSKEGEDPPRLAHFRRFWEGLDNLAYYWDSSSDEYIPPKPVDTENDVVSTSTTDESSANGAGDTNDEPRKRSKPNPNDGDDPANNRGFRLPIGPPVPKPPVIPATKAKREYLEAETPPGTYRGNRIGNGAGMPESYRNDTVRAFVEPIAWMFGFTLSSHRKPPVLEIKSLLVPIRLSSSVWQSPVQQRDRVRTAYLQGPVLGISCRGENGFAEGYADSTLDVLREVGALLCLAQERAREGKTERKPGGGKWWTSVPRWGGGPGGEMDDAAVESSGQDDEQVPVFKDLAGLTTSSGTGGGRGSAELDKTAAMARMRLMKKKQSLANAWKTLRTGVGLWDTRTDYTAVGKLSGSEWDEVYLVSSLNHHISILRLRVHIAYLDFLRTGEYPAVDAGGIQLPEESGDQQHWSIPVLSRSRWYDLFVPEDRLEAFRALYGILGYLARAE